MHLQFEGDGTSLDFRGRFSDGIVRGSVSFARSIVTPAWMEPTDLGNMRKYDSPALDRPRLEEFADATAQENATGALTPLSGGMRIRLWRWRLIKTWFRLAADDKLES